ncbi:hypothetical protein C3E97_033805, partial [Pseudomonas sp. MWU12-2115]|uniref:hypothetical protein n=1 Tax=Pseudomonas sp. MWU12-2115 TaxID=2071713 RepID=UPI000DFED3D5
AMLSPVWGALNKMNARPAAARVHGGGKNPMPDRGLRGAGADPATLALAAPIAEKMPSIIS